MNALFLRETAEGVILSIKVQPRACRTAVLSVLGSDLKIAIAAPPVDSAANEALLRFLSEALECPRNSVHLLRGHASRRKTILVKGLAPAWVVQKLGPQ